MADPLGFLIVPVGFRSDGSIHALELDNSDHLKTVNTHISEIRAALESVATDALRSIPLPHKIYDVSGLSQKIFTGSATNTTITTYTVPASTDFYLTSLQINVENTSGALSRGLVRIRDDGAATQISWNIAVETNTVREMTLNLVPPVHLKTGWDIQTKSFAASVITRAALTGYEVA